MPFPSNAQTRKILQRTGALLAVIITVLVVAIEWGHLSQDFLVLADNLITVFGLLLGLCIAGSLYLKNRE